MTSGQALDFGLLLTVDRQRDKGAVCLVCGDGNSVEIGVGAVRPTRPSPALNWRGRFRAGTAYLRTSVRTCTLPATVCLTRV